MEANGHTERPTGYKDVTSQYNNATANPQDSEDTALATKNRRKEIQFKASHVLLIGFFSWILFVRLPYTPGLC